MSGGSWRSRLLACGALVVAASLGVAAPANAAVTQCMTQSHSDGAKIVPGSNGGQKTRSIQRKTAPNTTRDKVWQGPTFECNESNSCRYAWERTNKTTVGWAVGGSTELGNTNSPSKKWYNVLVPLVGGYGQTAEIETTFTFEVFLKPRDVAAPIQVAIRRLAEGDFSGGWVRTNRGCRGGTTYEWQGNVTFGKWTRHVFEKELVKYSVNGKW